MIQSHKFSQLSNDELKGLRVRVVAKLAALAMAVTVVPLFSACGAEAPAMAAKPGSPAYGPGSWPAPAPDATVDGTVEMYY